AFFVGEVAGPAAFDSRHKPISQSDVGEGAAHHDLVVAATGAVAVEVAAIDAVVGQVLGGRAAGSDGACGRDVVRGHGVADHDEDARATDVANCGRLGRDAEAARRLGETGP